MNLIEIKKLFNKHGNCNLFKDFTFQEVEDAKKKVYYQLLKEKPNESEQLKHFLDNASNEIMEEKFMMGKDKPIGVVVKNTVRDNLNPDYKNTIKRIINLDSQYRPNIYPIFNETNTETNECDYTVHLSEKLINVVSMQIENIVLPFTFYNISKSQGNSFFIIEKDSSPSTYVTVELDDGFYDMDQIITGINAFITDQRINNNQSWLNLLFEKVNISNKIKITNNADAVNIYFFNSTMFMNLNLNNNITFNNNLGWILGFRNIYIEDTLVDFSYELANAGHVIAEATIVEVPMTKYISVVVNDFNNNQANGTVIQPKNDILFIKPTTHYNYQSNKNNKCLSNIKNCETLTTFINEEDRVLTKAQLYSRLQVNKHAETLNQQTFKLDCNTKNNVLAIIPIDNSIPFGNYYFNDKIKCNREYHGPVEIEKLQIQLYNDKGCLLNLNGNNWNMTITTEHLYKY